MELDVSSLNVFASSDTKDKDWTKATTKELVAHILERFHLRHREQLPELIHLAEKVERVHAAHAKAPLGLAAHLTAMLQELEGHVKPPKSVPVPKLGFIASAHGLLTHGAQRNGAINHGVGV